MTRIETSASTRPARIFTLLNSEISPRTQEIEIASSFQIPNFQVIGLPGPEVSEARERIRSAIEASGWEFPRRKIVLNLSPASVRKQGTGLDLAMAIAVLLESMRIEGRSTSFEGKRLFAWGELGLNGSVKGVRSPVRVIAAALRARADLIFLAQEDRQGIEASKMLFPESLLPEFRFLQDLRQFGLPHEPIEPKDPKPAKTNQTKPLSVKKNALLPIARETARFLEIAAAGMHHFLLLGPKGVGKSHALEWFTALQPEPDTDVLRSRLFISELSGKRNETLYRRIGMGCKAPSLLGSFSGGKLRPGEFSLAHGGVLMADEFPEWARDAREALREPLERKAVSLTRAEGTLEIPADFVFAGNGNLCPCGGFSGAGNPSQSGNTPSCRCHPLDRSKYLARLSGPVLDRIDLVYPFLHPRPAAGDDRSKFHESWLFVQDARKRLHEAYGKAPGRLDSDDLENFLENTPLVKNALESFSFESLRDRHKTLRIALTLSAFQKTGIQDALRDKEKIDRILLEAKTFRVQARKLLSP